MGVFDLLAIEDLLNRNPRRVAARRVKDLLEEHYIGSTLTESELEELALALCRRIPIPKPAVQRSLILPDGGAALRPDFTWVQQRVILEADGDRVHATRQARERRNLRDQRLIVHGWRPLHATARQLTQGSVELEATLIALVNGRR